MYEKKPRPVQFLTPRNLTVSLRPRKSNHRHYRLLRVRRKRPHGRRAGKCGQQFPPSDGDCHTPLPREVRKGNDTTPSACSPNSAAPKAGGGSRLSTVQFTMLEGRSSTVVALGPFRGY